MVDADRLQSGSKLWSMKGNIWSKIQTMYDIPVNAIRAFTAVYETGGVRPAARQLQVAHSSVSRHLQELEKWLGVNLFERGEGSRSLNFSPQGEALGRAGLENLKMLALAVKSVRETPRRNAVVVATTPSIAALWLLPRLPAFQKAYPWIELSVIAEQKLVDPTRQASDIAIRMGSGPWPRLKCEALMDDELYPVLSPALWEKAGKPTDPDELRKLPLIHDRDPNAPWTLWLAEHCKVEMDTSSGPRYSSSDLVLRAAAQGLGVSLARGRLAANEIASGALVKPFGERHVVLPNAYWIVRSPSAADRVAIAPVIAWLKSQAQSKLFELPAEPQS